MHIHDVLEPGYHGSEPMIAVQGSCGPRSRVPLLREGRALIGHDSI